MRIVFVSTVILVGTLSVAGQVGGNHESRNGSPTGMRGGFNERTTSPATAKVFHKAASLVHLAPDQLSGQYSSDASTCAVTPKSYVALLMAEEELQLDRRQTLQQMCANKTNSFAKALSVGGTMKVQLSGVAGVHDLQDRELAYRKKIDEAMKTPR
jgi:hypothetical protein